MIRSALLRLGTVVLAASLVAGCQSGVQDQSPNSQLPAGKVGVAEKMFVSTGTPTDANGNGFLDTIPVVVYLFPDPNTSAIPIWITGGRFRFITRSGGNVVGQWEFPPDMVDSSRVRLPPGPAYSFYLRLSAAQDQQAPPVVDLMCEFVRSDARRLVSPGVTTVRLGQQ